MQKKKLFSELKPRDMFLVLFIILIIALIIQFVLIEPSKTLRFIYPIEAYFAKRSIYCSDKSPVWLKESLKFAIQKNESLANQIAYIAPNRKIYTCQSGWQSHMFISDKVTEDTRFRYASMSKIFASHAILNLVNHHKLALDAKLTEILPQLQHKKLKDLRIANITVADLLSHQSGFDRLKSLDIMFDINQKPWCPYHIEELTKLKLDFQPNTYYAYDNRNYCLLGVIIEKNTGKSYREYINQLNHLSKYKIRFIDGPYLIDEVHYDFRNSDFWGEEYYKMFDFYALSSSAGLSGSAKGLAQAITIMLKQKPLNIISGNFDAHCHTNEFESCNGYAMLEYQQRNQNLKIYYKNGTLPGATSLAIVDNHGGVTVWTSNGLPINNNDYYMEKYIYEKLLNYYRE